MLRVLHLLVSLVTVTSFQVPHTGGSRRSSQLLPLLVAKDIGTNNKINLEQQALPLASPNDDSSAFQLLSDLAEACMLKSDIQRDAVVVDPKNVGKFQQASSASNWIHEPSAFALQQALSQVQLQYYSKNTASKSSKEDNDSKATQQDAIARREEAGSWIRWMKSVPSPAIVDLTSDLHNLLDTNSTVLKLLDQKPDEFKSRLFCRLLLFPSGLALDGPLVEPPNSIVYGKLLYGGVTRYRSLESSTGTSAHVNSKRDGARRAGERTAMQAHAPCWLMFGGAKRMYQAVDVGPAAVLELGLLPRKRELIVPVSSDETYVATPPGMVMIRNVPWSPHEMFGFVNEHEDQDNDKDTSELDDIASAASMSGMKRNQAFQSDFESSVGGLSLQINAIVRRVLDGRVMRPADEGSIQTKGEEWDSTTQQLATASLEAAELKLLGLEPVRGLLLYGPPGCGKTALAREISRALKARTPKIVAAPELLDRWVGGSEKAVRALFAEAEQELAVCGGDATRSALHVIVIDEIDAVFRKRSSAEDTGESTRSSVVNQILSKLDGINAIPNVLLIGMTNRRELLDEALLRPGRLEVQIEIPLPDKEGRREIFQIHFGPLRRNGRLSQPLCRAIDGKLPLSDMPSMYMRKRDYVKRKLRDVVELIPSISGGTYDLAADSVTGGFSGADIAGLVRCAGSIALARARIDGSGITGMLITLEDVKQALAEV
ncbi:hypothetical protein MPSEU_000338000 [Mayamaea pseudoterrestris]|nr:hypothetical protein MPSEU_000338000 [Mayamaea pseudoterrestris]